MLNFNAKEDKFHKMLLDGAYIVQEAASILRKSLNQLEGSEVAAEKIEVLEHKVDKLVIQAIKELNQAFITPMDREDIHLIMMGIEKIIDSINSAMHRFIMFDVREATDEAIIMADMMVQVTEQIVELMSELKLMNKKNKIKDIVIKINIIERDADNVFRKVVGDLFRNEKDPITIIKWKEIYQILENIMDDCERAANNVEGVVMKNA